MEIKGKITQLLPQKSGQSANGEWRKQEYILETSSEYPKKICFMAWGDKIDQFDIKQGENVEVAIDLESREYNGRWYTDVKAWRVSRDGTSPHSSYPDGNEDQNDSTHTITQTFDNDDEIPF